MKGLALRFAVALVALCLPLQGIGSAFARAGGTAHHHAAVDSGDADAHDHDGVEHHHHDADDDSVIAIDDTAAAGFLAGVAAKLVPVDVAAEPAPARVASTRRGPTARPGAAPAFESRSVAPLERPPR